MIRVISITKSKHKEDKEWTRTVQPYDVDIDRIVRIEDIEGDTDDEEVKAYINFKTYVKDDKKVYVTYIGTKETYSELSDLIVQALASKNKARFDKLSDDLKASESK